MKEKLKSVCIAKQPVKKNNELSTEDLDIIWDVLQLHNADMQDSVTVVSRLSNEFKLTYSEYLDVYSDLKKRGMEEKCALFFSSKFFVLMPKDKNGNISIELLHDLIVKKGTLSNFDNFSSNKGQNKDGSYEI